MRLLNQHWLQQRLASGVLMSMAAKPVLRIVTADVERSDEALMGAVATGDAEAFRVLVERHLAGVRRFCARATRADLADELTQETFTRLWQTRARWKPGTGFTALLYTVALNLCRNHARGQSRGLRAFFLVEKEGQPHAPAPDELLDAKEDTARLRRALESLPDAQREALLLQYAAGLDSSAVGEALGCNASTARSRVFHGLRRLRELLGETP